MRLTDIVSSMDMTPFPIIGLLIFLSLFALLVVRALLRDPRTDARAAALPLDDDNTPNPEPAR